MPALVPRLPPAATIRSKAVALRQYADMSYSDDDMLDMAQGDDAPEYPPTLCLCIDESDLEKAGSAGGAIGDRMRFAAMGEVMSVNIRADWTRIELKVTEFAGEDGKFVDLTTPAHICLCDQELEKLDLDADCELGDMLHLIGTARLDGVSRNEFMKQATLQIVELAVEDESSESREG